MFVDLSVIMVAIGFVKKREDGSYVGELRTLTISSPLEIRPNLSKSNERHPDFRVYAANDVEIGSGRKRIGSTSKAEYISLVLSIPEFGPKQLLANLGVATGQSDGNLFAILWNPEPDTRAR